MTFPLFAFLDVGTPELLLVMLAILMLFGGQRLPSLARGLGKSIREFKRASAGVEEEIKRAIETASEPQRTVQPTRTPNALAETVPAPGPNSAPPSPEPEAQLEPEATPNVNPSIKLGPQP